MVKIVLDTNVIVSALHFGGNPDKILNLANKGVIELIISPFILGEVADVLQRRFNWSEKEIANALAAIKEIATLIQPVHKLSVIKEKDSDNRILECAVSGKADFIVSGDAKHILPLKEYLGIKILKPTEFLAIKF
ncbi:MAG: putative toxin-antitoxin system toxin component, PIN family [Elusimicrobia bacterium]|nr:putative toxin-antitoxin system toxin component, PIN family [Elusimicrobiota bacterium]